MVDLCHAGISDVDLFLAGISDSGPFFSGETKMVDLFLA